MREFSNQPLSLDEIGQLLWSAQGLTDPAGLRTVPSAGALYPLETHVVVGKVSETQVGVYRYVPGRHELVREVGGDKRHDLAMAALQQSWMEAASIMVIFTIVGRRITAEYGRRGLRYAQIEVGHAAQNLALQAVSLGMGTTMVGAFDDEAVRKLLALPEEEVPVYIIPLGR